MLTIEADGREAARGDLRTPEGRAAIERFFAGYLCRRAARAAAGAARAGPQLLGRRARRWSRSSISPRSPRSRPRSARRSIRCAFAATSTSPAGRPGTSSICVGQEIAIGRHARLKIVKRIVRCAATNVDPDTGIRDLAIPHDADADASAMPIAGSTARWSRTVEIAVGDELQRLARSQASGLALALLADAAGSRRRRSGARCPGRGLSGSSRQPRRQGPDLEGRHPHADLRRPHRQDVRRTCSTAPTSRTSSPTPTRSART